MGGFYWAEWDMEGLPALEGIQAGKKENHQLGPIIAPPRRKAGPEEQTLPPWPQPKGSAQGLCHPLTQRALV